MTRGKRVLVGAIVGFEMLLILTVAAFLVYSPNGATRFLVIWGVYTVLAAPLVVLLLRRNSGRE